MTAKLWSAPSDLQKYFAQLESAKNGSIHALHSGKILNQCVLFQPDLSDSFLCRSRSFLGRSCDPAPVIASFSQRRVFVKSWSQISTRVCGLVPAGAHRGGSEGEDQGPVTKRQIGGGQRSLAGADHDLLGRACERDLGPGLGDAHADLEVGGFARRLKRPKGSVSSTSFALQALLKFSSNSGNVSFVHLLPFPLALHLDPPPGRA